MPTLLPQRTAALVHINPIAALCPFADVPAYAATRSLTQALQR